MHDLNIITRIVPQYVFIELAKNKIVVANQRIIGSTQSAQQVPIRSLVGLIPPGMRFSSPFSLNKITPPFLCKRIDRQPNQKVLLFLHNDRGSRLNFIEAIKETPRASTLVPPSDVPDRRGRSDRPRSRRDSILRAELQIVLQKYGADIKGTHSAAANVQHAAAPPVTSPQTHSRATTGTIRQSQTYSRWSMI